MSDSIRERIETQVRKTLSDALVTAFTTAVITDANVQRYDDEANRPVAIDANGIMPGAWVLVSIGDEDELGADDGESAIGFQTRIMPVAVDVHILTVPSGQTLARYANAWMAAVNNALMGNPQWAEAVTGELLALDTLITGAHGPRKSPQEGDRLCGVEAEIVYRHRIADASTRT